MLRTRPLPLLLALPLALAACTTSTPTGEDAAQAVTLEDTGTGTDADDHTDGEREVTGKEEVAAPQPRLVTTYDGGLLVIDASSLEVVADLPLPGFNRLNAAGDGRHVLVSTTADDEPGFRVLDAATWTSAHGDHGHHFVADPALTDLTFPAEEPGHAIPHGGVTTLFDDGTGQLQIFDPTELADGTPEVEERTLPSAHHGFAFLLDDGSLVATLGDEESRHGIVVTDASGEEVARSEDCPGVHGEAVAQGEAVLAGCDDGVLVHADGVITKITSPDPYGRIGNQYVTETSPVALGDYKHDPDQGIALHEVTLIDTATATLQVVDLPEGVEYTWRGLGRGPADEALVLGTDGSLHVLDEVTGELLATYPVIAPWQAPEEWQAAHPALLVVGETAYVTEPATQEIHAVDLPTGEVYRSGTLPAAPNEIAVADAG